MQVLVLNASLKRGNEPSNTEEVTNMVLDEMRKYGRVDAETIRLARPNQVEFDEAENPLIALLGLFECEETDARIVDLYK